LEKVDLREAWATEAGDFTPWLASVDNLALLGDAIGLELELEGTEQNVGPFRADILCKDTATGHWVLIENQLGRTDHTHLGQLLTYAAGLKAVTIVWIAAPFTDEHRAVLDWLNEITDEDFNFFGLEVELWRIGTSPFAPKFNIVAKPNDWTTRVSRAANAIAGEALSETRKLQYDFWTGLRAHMEAQPGKVKPVSPAAQNWLSFGIGRTNLALVATVNNWEKWVSVYLQIGGPHAKALFHQLSADKNAIEGVIGQQLEWRERPDKKESHIRLRTDAKDPNDPANWPTLSAWIAETLVDRL